MLSKVQSVGLTMIKVIVLDLVSSLSPRFHVPSSPRELISLVLTIDVPNSEIPGPTPTEGPPASTIPMHIPHPQPFRVPDVKRKMSPRLLMMYVERCSQLHAFWTRS